jgi:prolyl 4-hydroxylase
MKEAFLLIFLLVILCAILVFISRNKARGFTRDDAPWEHPQIVSNVLTPEDCTYLIEKATPVFERSGVVGAIGADDSRTSQTAWIPKTDSVAQKVFARALQFTGKTLDECEDLQVVKYEPNTYYREHHDSCCEGSRGCIDFEKDGGQRVATLLVYLNSDFTDGETHFPNLDLKLKAEPGSAILFRPLGSDEAKCHPKALHAGLPISSGVKYVCNAWVRENKFRD